MNRHRFVREQKLYYIDSVLFEFVNGRSDHCIGHGILYKYYNDRLFIFKCSDRYGISGHYVSVDIHVSTSPMINTVFDY